MIWCFKRSSYFYLFSLIYFGFQAGLLYYMNKSNHGKSCRSVDVFDTYKSLSLRLNGSSQTDISGKFKILPMTSTSKKNSSFDVTLVSQCSSNHIHLIKNLIDSWKGPLSIAVFEDGENIEMTIWELSKLLNCEKNQDLTIHLVIPAQNIYLTDFKYASNLMQNSGRLIICQFRSQEFRRNYNGKEPYPVNLLRNIAKAASFSDYAFIIDIDMTPSANLREYFLNYIKNNPTDIRATYVVPAFEIRGNYQIPDDKSKLIELIHKNVIQPFYFLVCPTCQKATEYDKWMLSNVTTGTQIIYEVKWKHPWEPFFIAKSNMPDFDERFKQYGINRVSQVEYLKFLWENFNHIEYIYLLNKICELHVAGYKFFVLDNVYVIHRGFKFKNDFHETKNAEMDSNRLLYDHFKQELKYRYPGSEKQC